MQVRTLATAAAFALVAAEAVRDVSHLRRVRKVRETRQLQSNNYYYHTLTSSVLGDPNPDAAIGNPLKGLVESPIYTNPPYKVDVPLAVEFYYLDLGKVMKGNPDKVGEAAAFDWTYLDQTLTGSASRNMHAAWRVICEFPGQDLKVPQYLIDDNIELRTYTDDGKTFTAPYYGDAKLIQALQQFIAYSGKRYDGDKRLGFVQMGLLGKWGEWHHEDGFLPDSTKQAILTSFIAAYPNTQVQSRYSEQAAFDNNMGRHDDSFTYNTLDGAANGGEVKSFFFWPDAVRKGTSESWRRGATGGETRSANAGFVFEEGYPARTKYKQSFMECVNVTHTTWMFHHAVWKENNRAGMQGKELANARFAHARMGYNFHVPSVAVKAASASGQVDVDVTVAQIGVAPFYYDLGLGLSCSGMTKKTVGGIDSLIDQGATKTVSFTGVPATAECLKVLTISLESSYAYSGRPIKFAQGNGALVIGLPLPGSGPQPQPQPTPVGAAAPVPTRSNPTGSAPVPVMPAPAPSRPVLPPAPMPNPVFAPLPVASRPVVVAAPVPVMQPTPLAASSAPVPTGIAPAPRASPAMPVSLAPMTQLTNSSTVSVPGPTVVVSAPLATPTGAPMIQPPAPQVPRPIVSFLETRPVVKAISKIRKFFRRGKQ